MCELITHGKPIVKPWKLVSDGDLWEHSFKALDAKGSNAFRASWVKGHADEEHVRRGVPSEQNREGNFKPDLIADAGTDAHGKETMSVLRTMQIRFKAYVKLMSAIVRPIVDLCCQECLRSEHRGLPGAG